jgi:hypothetical protein
MTRRPPLAMLLAFLIPGAGHLYLGRRGRAAAFFVIVASLFVMGLTIDGGLYTFAESGDSILSILASLGSMGAGLLYFIGKSTSLSAGQLTSITFEYGHTFTLTAGLMNLLLILDSYDIAKGRKP